MQEPFGTDTQSRAVQAALEACAPHLRARMRCRGRPVIAVAIVRNECDIIESFVRHALTWADGLLVIDHSSTDGTSEILTALHEEGLPMSVVSDRAIGFHQGDRMTMAARFAAAMLDAGVVLPLDADEFLVDEAGGDPRDHLRRVPPERWGIARWQSYIPTEADDETQPDILRRITMRLEREPAVTNHTIILGGDFALRPGMRISHGNHRAFVGTRVFGAPGACTKLRLAHFPVRTAQQLASKIAAKTLSTPFASERSPRSGWFYGHLLNTFPRWWDMSRAELRIAAESYFKKELGTDIALTADPVAPPATPLRYSSLARPDSFHNVYEIAAGLAKRLGELGGAGEITPLRGLITEENRRLRVALERVADALGQAAEDLVLDDLEARIMARIGEPAE